MIALGVPYRFNGLNLFSDPIALVSLGNVHVLHMSMGEEKSG